jgi:regulator of nucleoside diphosphate kinase
MSPPKDASRQPPIVLCVSDRDALERAALAALLTAPRLAGPLLEEVDRALVVADEDLGEGVVRLGSWVVYRDEASGALSRARLVRPPGGGAPDELSALSPEGAALVGLRPGQSIRWLDHMGVERLLTVVGVAVDAAASSFRTGA